MTVGENLRRLRLERGLKQAELAEDARSSQQTISEIENGHRGAQTKTLEKLADALGVPVGAFFADGDGSTPPVPPRPRTPLTDEKPEAFDKRFAATDVTSAEKLTEKVGAEFDELRQYVEQLKAAGIGDEDFRLKRARVRLTEAKRRTYATTTRMNDLGLKAEFGQDRPIFETVAEYVGKAEETDERIGKEAAHYASAKRVEQSGKAG